MFWLVDWLFAPHLYVEFADAFVAMGSLQLQLHEWTAAERSFQSALSVAGKPKADTFFGLGVSLARQKKFAASVQAFASCVQLDPGHAEAYVEWGEVLKLNLQVGGAISCFKHALSKGKHMPLNVRISVLMQLGEMLEQSGNLSGAARCFEEVLENCPDHEIARLKLPRRSREK